MAGDKTKNKSTPLKVTQSTPIAKQEGVIAATKYAALAKYEVNVRSFHPNKQFEPAGFRFHGDNRGFSLGDSYFSDDDSAAALKGKVTSRIWQRYMLDMDLKEAGDLTKNSNANLDQESNPSSSGPGLWSVFGSEEPYTKKEYKPRGKLSATHVNVPHGGQKEVGLRSWYGGENHAFMLSRAVHDTTGQTFVPTLDVFSDLFVRVERVNLYMDIVSLVYGDGFPNGEAFLKDSAGNKLFLGTHVRIGVPASHLAGESRRLMWANAIRIEIDAQGNFGERLWVFGQALGGSPELREEYPTSAFFEVCKVGAKTEYVDNPFSEMPGYFKWNCGKLESLIRHDSGTGPLHLSAFTDIEQVRAKVQETWTAGPALKTTRTQWNNSHLHRNPNEGRDKDDYDVSPDKWKK